MRSRRFCSVATWLPDVRCAGRCACSASKCRPSPASLRAQCHPWGRRLGQRHPGTSIPALARVSTVPDQNGPTGPQSALRTQPGAYLVLLPPWVGTAAGYIADCGAGSQAEVSQGSEAQQQQQQPQQRHPQADWLGLHARTGGQRVCWLVMVFWVQLLLQLS